jgi:hypothetical protein
MSQIKTLLESINETLKQLTRATERQNQILQKLLNERTEDEGNPLEGDLIVDLEEVKGLSYIPVNVLNADLFKRLTDVYYLEEIHRRQSNRSKKSARRVSVKLYETLEDFFYEHIKGVKGLEIKRSKEGFIVFKKDNISVASLKYMTDLGFIRGERWYEEMNKVVETSEKMYGTGTVFVLIASLFNGVEKSHIEKILHHPISSVGDFLSNETLTRTFVDRYTDGLKVIPKERCFILSASKHPNVMVDHLLKTENKEEFIQALDGEPWFSHIEDLIHQLRVLLT